ncbi:MAG TPA: hypothetical protein PK622_01960 [Saprospiraceae bacterium]|nr:hypothetical protein [Saprospiraceae bacterium]
MINLCELKLLIEIERTQIKGNLNTDHLGYGFIEPTSEIEAESMKEYGVNFASNFLLESYCGTTFRSVNKHLRSTKGAPTDPFIVDYEKLLNKLLDGISAFNDNTVWRWVNCYEEFDFLKTQVGKNIVFPGFKSTSIKKLPDRSYWNIKTHVNDSNGKQIYKHIDKRKGDSEKEILFKSQTSFRILGVEENCINLVETKGETVDFVLSKDFKC